jgi:YVTN family beta-propeller protein
LQTRFAKPGHYYVSVRTEGKNILSSDAVVVTIHGGLTAQRSTHSSSIAADQVRKVIYNVNSDQGTVSAVTMDSLTKIWETQTGQDPKSLSVDNKGRVWVANSRGDSITVLDGANGSVLKQISLPYGSMPFGISVSPQGDKVYVTLAARGELVTLSAEEMRVLKFTRVGMQPRALAISADGVYALISRFISTDARGEVYKVDLRNDSVQSIGLAIDKTADTESSGRGLPNYLGFLAISPDGQSAWVPSKKDNIQRGLTRDGLVPDFESSVRAIVSQIDLGKNSETIALRNDFNDRDMPVAVEYSPLGDYVFVAVQGSNSVEILDAYTGTQITGLEKVGLAPQGLTLSADGKRLFVHSFLSREILVYDVARLDRATKIKTISVVANETLSEEELLGKQIFYNSKDRRMSRDGYISCASCHQDGGEDGRVWDFTDRGEGLRNTITLRGRAGMAQGRVHWTGNFDEIQDFENDIRNNFGGTGFLTDEQFKMTQDTLGTPKAGLSKELDALAAYVKSLSTAERSPYRQADGTFTEEALKGEKVFARLQCAQCHSGNDFTDSAQGSLHNVGTMTSLSGQRRKGPLTGLDTPSLRGIWATPPYLHDGSANSLREVFTKRNSKNQHGTTQSLTQEELNQLIQYLLSL